MTSFDLDAKRAERSREGAAREAGNEPFTFTFGGQAFALKPPMEWPANAKRLIDQDDFATLIDAILDGDGRTRFWALDPAPSIQDVTDLFEAWSATNGLGDLPNSSAPRRRASTRK